MMYEDKQIALMAMKAPQMMEREAVVKCIGFGRPPLKYIVRQENMKPRQQWKADHMMITYITKINTHTHRCALT